MTLHEDDWNARCLLLTCFAAGRVIDIRREAPSNPSTTTCLLEDFHNDYVTLYGLIDKYDCEGFTSDCERFIARYAQLLLNRHWDVSKFMEYHYEAIANTHGGQYPEVLCPVLAEAWRILTLEGQPCVELDTIIEGSHALTVAVAKALRARVSSAIDGMAAAKEATEALM